MPQGISIVEQGPIVADSLQDYLRRHPEIDAKCSKGATCRYLTTDEPDKFSSLASVFVHEVVQARKVSL